MFHKSTNKSTNIVKQKLYMMWHVLLPQLWTCIKYSTIETKEVLDIMGFFFRMSTQVKAEVRSTKAVTWVRMRKKKPVISNTGKFFSFNNNVSNLYNNSVEKIYGMAYIFTLLMFRKPNKTTINKSKTTNFYRLTSFRFLFIFRYFKVFQVKIIVYILDISRSFKCPKSSPVVCLICYYLRSVR